MNDVTLDLEETEFACQRCGFYNVVSFKQVRIRDVIICRGCKSNTQLDDYMNTFRKAEREIRLELADLEREMKRLSTTITLKL